MTPESVGGLVGLGLMQWLQKAKPDLNDEDWTHRVGRNFIRPTLGWRAKALWAYRTKRRWV